MYEEAAMTTTTPTSVNKLNNNALPSIAASSSSHQLINISSANAANITVAIVSTCDQQTPQQQQQQALITEMHPASSSSSASAASHVAILSHGRKIIINNNSITSASSSEGDTPTSHNLHHHHHHHHHQTTTLCLTSPEVLTTNKSKAIIPNNLNNTSNNKTNVIVSTHQMQQQQQQPSSVVTTTDDDIYHPQILQQQQLIITTTTVPTVSHQTASTESMCEVTQLQNLVTTSEQVVSPASSGIIVQANNEGGGTTDDGGPSTSMSADNMVEFDIQDLNNCSTDDTSEANLMTFLYGIAAGWASKNLVLLQSEDSPLESGQLTLFQASWVGSILCVGGAIGQMFFSYLADRYGRKPALTFSFIPEVISWFLIIYGEDFYSLFVSRFLSGFVGGAVYQILPLFVSEVSNVEIRGMLGSFLMLFTNLGVLVGYIVCSYLPYRVVPWLAIGVSFVFLLGFSIVPETPKYVAMKSPLNEEKLKKSMEFYSGKPFDKEFFMPKTSEEPTNIKIKALCNTSTRKAFKISFFLMSCTCFSGVFTVLNYSETIFAEAGSTLSPELSSIIVAVIQLAGSYLATLVVERAGRRILILSSTFGSALCLGTMGAHSFLKDNGFDVSSFAWLPLVCLSLLLFIAANGATTVSFIVIGEVFAQNVRGLAISLCLLYQWMLAFALLLVFPYLIQFLQMSGALWVFTAVGMSIATVLVFILPETKGRTIDEIVEILGRTSKK